MNSTDRAILSITSALLDRGRTLDALSSALTVVAALSLLLGAIGAKAVTTPVTATGFALAIVGLGLAAKYLAVRVAFDAALLRRCAADQTPVAEFDAAMRAINLLPAVKTGRSWLDRCQGARRLLKLQAVVLLAQTVALILAVVAAR